jgi:D-glycero-alpha-D-manno-heptose-7-phosphate kinase
MSSSAIDDLYDLARRNGAIGGKIVGAGGGGFLLVYTTDAAATRAALTDAGAPEVRFGFDFQGCTGTEYQ